MKEFIEHEVTPIYLQCELFFDAQKLPNLISNRDIDLDDWAINTTSSLVFQATSQSEADFLNQDSLFKKVECVSFNSTSKECLLPKISDTDDLLFINGFYLIEKVSVKVVSSHKELHLQWFYSDTKGESSQSWKNDNISMVGRDIQINQSKCAHEIKILYKSDVAHYTSLANKYLGKSPNELGRSNWNELRADFIEELNQLTLK